MRMKAELCEPVESSGFYLRHFLMGCQGVAVGVRSWWEIKLF